MLLEYNAKELQSRKQFGKGRLEVLSTATVTVIVVWGVTPCSLVEIYRRFQKKKKLLLLFDFFFAIFCFVR